MAGENLREGCMEVALEPWAEQKILVSFAGVSPVTGKAVSDDVNVTPYWLSADSDI